MRRKETTTIARTSCRQIYCGRRNRSNEAKGGYASSSVPVGRVQQGAGRISRPQTFMEIGGYPHYENVCSNFLAFFFFDLEGPHGLGTRFLDALLDSVGIAGGENVSEVNVSVERKVGTELDVLEIC